MNEDRRTDGSTRARPKSTEGDVAARRARRAAEGAPIRRRPGEGISVSRPRNATRSGAGSSARAYRDEDDYFMGTGSREIPITGRRMPPPGRKRRKKPGIGRTLIATAIAIVSAILVSALMHTFVFEIVRVSGDAMYGALRPGDWALITKFDYWADAPERGDIVAVKVDNGTILRRIVGLPAETVEIDGNGDTLINGDPLGEGYVELKNFTVYPKVELPGGRYFVLSDNRTVTLDSRNSGVDLVAKQRIIGKVRAILFPFGRSGTLQSVAY